MLVAGPVGPLFVDPEHPVLMIFTVVFWHVGTMMSFPTSSSLKLNIACASDLCFFGHACTEYSSSANAEDSLLLVLFELLGRPTTTTSGFGFEDDI